MDTEKSLGAWVRKRRHQLDLTQEELAEQVGCSPETLRKLEANTRRPSKQLAERLALSLALPQEEHGRFVAFARGLSFSAEGNGEAGAPSLPFAHHVDWGEAPDVSAFFGRENELALLRRWLLEEHCRLILLLGMGGIGKTALAAQVAHAVQERFEYVLWTSLRNAPLLPEVLEQWLLFFSDPQAQDRMAGVDQQIRRLLEHLRRHRCLLVLDNAEAILAEREQAGQYRPGYEGYGQFLQALGESRHQSCVLVTSREKPQGIRTVEAATSPMRSLAVGSLPPEDGRALLAHRGLFGIHEHWAALTERYSGNPLALQVVAEMIRELLGGDIAAFLREETTIFGGVRDLLAAHFARLSALEQELMLWLAVEREAVGMEALHAELLRPVSKAALWEALHSLRRRSLIEQSEAGLTLQNVVMEYVTEYLVTQVVEEISTASARLLERHALVKAQAKEYVRESQRRMLLLPVAERLPALFGKDGVEARLFRMLAAQRQNAPRRPGYLGGNLLNLLVALQSDLSGQDFSQLAIWQADLRDVKLHGADFSDADLSHTLFTMPLGLVQTVALSPDGARLAIGTYEGAIHIWRLADAQPLLGCTGHTGVVHSLSFSPDGKTLASGSFDGTVRLWDLSPRNPGQELCVLRDHDAPVFCVRFSPDGRFLASSGEDRRARLWDVGLGFDLPRCHATLENHSENVTAVAFSPNGELLATRGGEMFIWRVSAEGNPLPSPALVRSFAVTHFGMAICFSPDSKRIAAPNNANITCIWDIESGECLHSLAGHSHYVTSLAFTPDGRLLATGSADMTVRIWAVEDSGAVEGTEECLKVLQGHQHDISHVCFGSDGSTLISGSYDQTVRLWDVQSGRSLRVLQGYGDIIKAIDFSPDGKLLASASWSRVESLRLWDIATEPENGAEVGPRFRDLRGHRGVVTAIAFSPDGALLASGGQDQVVRVWDIAAIQSSRSEISSQDGQVCALLTGHRDAIKAVSFRSDGQLLASAGDSLEIRFWKITAQGGVWRQTLPAHNYRITALSFSPHGSLLASASNDEMVALWDEAGDGEVPGDYRWLHTFRGHSQIVRSISFNAEGSLLASGSYDQTVRVWDVHRRQLWMVLEGHSGLVQWVCFHPDGKRLASASQDGTVRIWEVEEGRCLHILRGHSAGVTAVTYSADGTILASGSQDGEIRLWTVGDAMEEVHCTRILHNDRPYERMRIAGISGVTPAQVAALRALGAVDG